MGTTLDMYRRYRGLLERGTFDHLTEVISEDFVETCVGLTRAIHRVDWTDLHLS
jgi:hypothetical protein